MARTRGLCLFHLVSPSLSCEMRMPRSCWGRVGVDEITEWAEMLPGQAWPCRGQAALPTQAGCG